MGDYFFEKIFCICHYLLIGEEVNNISKSARGAFVQFAVTTLGARDYHELFILYIKNLGESSAGSSDLVDFVAFVVTFRTDVFSFLHSYVLRSQRCHHHRFDGMQPILSFVENKGCR